MDPVKIIGVIGLILISIGIITKKRRNQDLFYIFGGIGLEIYSLALGDLIFILLQVLFTLAAVYDLVKISNKK